MPCQGVILALELLDDGTVAVLERVHHLLQEEPERSEIVFREDFTGDMQRVFALAAELLHIAVRVTDSRANRIVWLIRSKVQHQWRAALRILARVPVTFESQCVAEERRIRDRLEEAVIETDVGQDEQVARIVVVLSSRVVPHVKVAAWFHSRARLAETRSGPGLLENILHVLCRAIRRAQLSGAKLECKQRVCSSVEVIRPVVGVEARGRCF